jgi:hypothetical protein
MATNDILARVLVLQDRVGVRQSGHFDHDSHAMTGPAEAVVASRARPTLPKGKRPGQLSFRFVRDPETGEILSR